MKQYTINAIIGIFVLLVSACSNESEIDTIKPEIDLSYTQVFPSNCDTIFLGEPFILKMRFSDNMELGSYSINVHHNFDSHSHSTEVTTCIADPHKDPVNPYVLTDTYNIPDGLMQYETDLSISVPKDNGFGLFDEGDYHFLIQLTDKEGWSTQKGISIKMLHRQ